jgi:hypothetical protein
MFVFLTPKLGKPPFLQDPPKSTQITQHTPHKTAIMADEPPPAKRVKSEMSSTFDVLAGNDFFVVLVGPIPQKFTLRSESFLPRSEFLQRERKKAWNNESKRYSDEPIILANYSPHAFADYARFVYFGDVPECDYDKYQAHFIKQIGLYALAERLGDFKTANRMSDDIYTHSRDCEIVPEKDVVNLAYRSTQRGSLLRALFRDIMIYERIDPRTDDLWYEGYLNEFHSEFRDDVLVELMNLVIKDPESTVDEAVGQEVLHTRIMNCELHHHEEDDQDDWNPKCLRSDFTDILNVVAARKHTFR